MIEKKDIEDLAALSRVELTDSEVESLRGDMESILGYVGSITSVAGEEADTASRVGLVKNVMREDDNPHEPGIHTEALLNEAPEREGNLVKVKKIL